MENTKPLYTLPKSVMLRRNKEFSRVYSKGTSYGSHLMVLIIRRSNRGVRVGFVCGKKVGNSVMRNRARRRMRESFRLLQVPHRAKGYDIIFIARSPIAQAGYKEVSAAMEKLLYKAGVIS